MKTNIPERPKDPELAELHDLAVAIQEKNDICREIRRSGWIIYAIGLFVATFIPRLASAGWGIFVIGAGVLIAAMVYNSKKIYPLRVKLYDKSNQQRRQHSLQIIDQIKSAVPEKNVKINYEGNIVLSDREGEK